MQKRFNFILKLDIFLTFLRLFLRSASKLAKFGKVIEIFNLKRKIHDIFKYLQQNPSVADWSKFSLMFPS